MDFAIGQLVVILAPYMENEVYANIKYIMDDKLSLTLKSKCNLIKGRDILCLVINNHDMYEFYSHVEDVAGNDIYIRKPIKTGLSAVEKRKFNRADCSIGFVGMPTILGDRPIISTDKKFSGTIKNVSAGGVLAEIPAHLPKDSVFCFKLKLNFFVDCIAIVRRTIEIPSSNIFECGCEFVNLSLENVKTISLYVFREQLKLKRKEMLMPKEQDNNAALIAKIVKG